MQFIKNCTAEVIAAHLELAGFEMQKGVKSVGGMSANAFSKVRGSALGALPH